MRRRGQKNFSAETSREPVEVVSSGRQQIRTACAGTSAYRERGAFTSFHQIKCDCRAQGPDGHVVLTHDRFGIQTSGGCAYFTARRQKTNAEAPSPMSLEAMVSDAREPDRTAAPKCVVETESRLRCFDVGGFLSLVRGSGYLPAPGPLRVQASAGRAY
jgi:hypothetical protein